MKFRTKLTLGMAAVLFGTALAFLAFFSVLARNLAVERMEEKALALARNLASNSSEAVYTDDLYKQLAPLLKSMLATPDVLAASVLDASGRVLASAGEAAPGAAESGWRDAPGGRVFAATAPVSPPAAGLARKDKPVGYVRVAVSFKRLRAGIRRMLLRSAALALLMAATGLLLAALLSRRLTRPIVRILEADEAVVRGDREKSDIPEAEIPDDELGRIMRSRSVMIAATRRSEKELQTLAENERNRAAELEKAYLELRGLREQLTQSEKLSLLGQVVSGVAHEINNPLSGIMGFSELLLKEQLVREQPRMREDVASILHEAKRCQAVVKGLTGFARKRKPEKSLLSVNAVLEQSLKFEASLLKTRNILVKREFDPSLPYTLADYYQLQQVFMNLFVNAQQAMAEQKGGGTLTVRTRLAGGLIRVEVEDDGPGIPPENLCRVFEPFFTTKEPGKGTGLGLSLSYGIVSEHGGTIRAESRPGKGALFVVELPVLKEAPAAGGAESAAASPLAGLKVLVVDDEILIRNVSVRLLRAMDCDPDTAAGGAEAMRKLKTNDYDVVISDIRMPDMDGRELYHWVRENKPEFASRWIFMTGSTSSDELVSTDGTGRPSIHKPFTFESLQQRLQSMPRAARRPQ
ncbi:MAG: ATP-binding protein [Elusimicrobia bacterium]|nr:ATP-binding protein [Elusimicrobiota bacterium]